MYRFSELIGYEQVITHFQNAIAMNKISHAYIIEGEEGSGKKTMARTFAKLIQCESKQAEVCDQCVSCRLMNSRNHPDIIEIVTEKKTGLGVDEVRELINRDIMTKPYQYPYKIYIVDMADDMTIQAQNALLKTIEEPPVYGIILLLARNSYRFLPTILSRCVVVKLNPIPEEVLENYLIEHEKIPDYQAMLYAAFARGNVGRGKQLATSSDFVVMRDNMIKVMEIFATGSKIDILDAVDIFEAYQDEKDIFLELLLTWLRDLLMLKKLKDQGKLIHKDKKNQLLKQAPLLSYNSISLLIEGLEKTQLHLKFHINYALSVEMMLINAVDIEQ